MQVCVGVVTLRISLVQVTENVADAHVLYRLLVFVFALLAVCLCSLVNP